MNRLVRHCLSPLLALALIAAAAQAADQTQTSVGERRLSDWVGDDLGLCLELNDLPRHWASFAEGPLAKRLWAFPPLAAWREQNREVLSAVRGEIERRTGVPPKVLLRQLLGRVVLFAIWPPADLPAGKPNVLLLAEAVDRDLIERTLKTLVSARKKAGKWRGETSLQVAGEKFIIDAVTPDDEQAEFYVTSADRVAMIATSEAILRDVLERRANSAKASSLAGSPAYRAAGEHVASDAAARLFINPRAWDAALRADLQRKPPGSAEARSQKAVVAAWAATDYVGGAVHLDRNLNAELAWRWRADKLPPAVREVAGSFSGTSSMTDDLPGDALVAFAAHADLGRLVRLIIAKEWKNTRGDSKKRGESVLAWALAAGVGPDIAGYLKAPPVDVETSGERLPLEAAIALQTRPLEPGTGRPALVHQVEPLMHAWLTAAVAARNHPGSDKPASIKTEKFEDRQGPATIVSGIVPGHRRQELVYRVDADDRLWFATSTGLLKPAVGSRSVLTEAVGESQYRRGDGLSGVAYVNLSAWRELAARGRDAVDFLWRDKRLDEGASERKYRELQALAQLGDRILLTSQIDSSSVHLLLALTADEK